MLWELFFSLFKLKAQLAYQRENSALVSIWVLYLEKEKRDNSSCINSEWGLSSLFTNYHLRCQQACSVFEGIDGSHRVYLPDALQLPGKAVSGILNKLMEVPQWCAVAVRSRTLSTEFFKNLVVSIYPQS